MDVVLNHVVVGVHDERCIPLPPERIEELHIRGLNPNLEHPWHWRHEGNVLVVVENSMESRRYQADEWTNAGPKGTCGARPRYLAPCCPRCGAHQT